MNKIKIYISFAFLFLLLNAVSFSQNYNVTNPEKIYVKRFYENSAGELNLLLNRTRQIWLADSLRWENDSLIIYSYKNDNLLDTIIFRKWRNGMTWCYDGSWTFFYNQQNKLSEKYINTPSFDSSARYNYIYYGNNLGRINGYHNDGWGGWNHITQLDYLIPYNIKIEIFRAANFYGTLCNVYKIEDYYDSNQLLIEKLIFSGNCSSSWKLNKREIYYYDDIGNRIEDILQDWNPVDSTWITRYQYLYEYDGNYLSRTLYRRWITSSLEWQNVWQEHYTYNVNNYIHKILKEQWSINNWEYFTLKTYTYDFAGNWTEDVTQIWDNTYWKNQIRYLATWEILVDIKNQTNIAIDFKLSQNYPNPFNPSTKIKYQIPVSGLVTLKVYDVLGTEIVTLVNEEKPAGENEVEFDGSKLPSGIYFYKLQAGEFVKTKKMILMK